MDDKIIKGMPSMALFPPKNYLFKVNEENYVIKLPRKGLYHDIDPAFYDEDSGEFNIYDEESKVLYLPSITKVLFATEKYPDMKFNQFFVPYSIKFEDEEIVLTGQVIEIIFPAGKKEDK